MKPAEILVTCPWCKLAGFTERGIRAHHCDKLGGKRLGALALDHALSNSTPSPMPKEKPSKKNTPSAVVTLEDKTLAAEPQRLGQFKAAVIDQVELIATTERNNTERRLYVGAALTVIKTATEAGKHGKFKSWLKENVKGAGYTQCTYMMRAARVFFEETGMGKAEVLSLVSGNGTIEITTEGPAAKLQNAARKFVGEMTWGELLNEHGIREDELDLGGARKKKIKPAPAPTAEELYNQTRDELGSLIERGKTLFLTENRLQYLVGHPEEIAGVAEGFRDLADKIDAAAKAMLKSAKK